jgi:putative addiction module component (TIGR02574 family)
MSILNQHQISTLSFDEKVALIDDLWASMDCNQVGLALDSAYDRMLERRVAGCDEELDIMLTLDRASRQLREMLTSMTPPAAASATNAA